MARTSTYFLSAISVLSITGLLTACSQPRQTCIAPRTLLFGVCALPCEDGSTGELCQRDSGVAEDGDAAVDSPMIDVNTDSSSCSDIQNNPNHCGRCNNVCPMVENAEALCAMGMCSSRCRMGTERVGANCEILAPRLIGPMSTSYVTTHRPTLRWELPAGLDGARVEICSARSCGPAEIEQTIDAMGTSVRPMMALTPGVHWWRVKGRLMGSTGMRTSATWEFFVRQRDTPIDTSWGSVLDVNGDGYADVATGSSEIEPGPLQREATSVRVFLGGPMGLQANTVVLPGPTIESAFGRALSSAGDVNGDGYGDLIVGAPGAEDPPNLRAGKAFVYLGSSTGLMAMAAWEITGGATDARLGASVSFVGDLDADGYADVVVGSPENDFGDTGHGRALIFRGQRTGIERLPFQTIVGSDREHLGVNVRSAGDLNGDNVPDLFVASLDGGGLSRSVSSIYLGTSRGFTVPAHRQFVRDAPNHTFGFYSTNVGDSNGDGYSDFVFSSRVGIAEVFEGSAAGIGAVASRVLMTEGEAIQVTAGDVNNDGFDDVFIGLPLLSVPMATMSEMGAIRWFPGSINGLAPRGTAIYSTQGTLGLAVGGAGDIDRDGSEDFFVRFRDQLNPEPMMSRGIRRYRATAGGPVLTTSYFGPRAEENFGANITYSR